MSKPINDDEDKLLKDGQRLRIPLLMMDGRTVQTTINPALHRSGYRYLATDAVAATRRQMAYDDYHARLTSAWRTADADNNVLDREFDEEDCYACYDARISSAWAKGR